MSAHYIYIACSEGGCDTTESVYTGSVTTNLFDDSGPDSWEGEFIYIKCKKCKEA